MTIQLDRLEKQREAARKYINEATSPEQRQLRKMEVYSTMYSYGSVDAINKLKAIRNSRKK